MNCPCHGEPMRWNKNRASRDGGYWRCKVRSRELARKYWEQTEGVAYNKRLLQMRRACAMYRRRNRKD